MRVEAVRVVMGQRGYIWEKGRREFHAEVKTYKHNLVFYSEKAKARSKCLYSPIKLIVL